MMKIFQMDHFQSSVFFFAFVEFEVERRRILNVIFDGRNIVMHTSGHIQTLRAENWFERMDEFERTCSFPPHPRQRSKRRALSEGHPWNRVAE